MRMTEDEINQQFCWVARKACGCVIGVCTDFRDKATGQRVAEFIAAGLLCERVSWPRYREIATEPTFFACPHANT